LKGQNELSKLIRLPLNGLSRNRFACGIFAMIVTLSVISSANSVMLKNGQACPSKKYQQIIKSGTLYLVCAKTGKKYFWKISNSKDYKTYKNKLAQIELIKMNLEYEESKKALAEKDAAEAQNAKQQEDVQNAKRYAENQAQRDSIQKGPGYRCAIGKFCSI